MPQSLIPGTVTQLSPFWFTVFSVFQTSRVNFLLMGPKFQESLVFGAVENRSVQESITCLYRCSADKIPFQTSAQNLDLCCQLWWYQHLPTYRMTYHLFPV